MAWWLKPSLAVSADMQCGFSLYTLCNIDGELDAVVAESAGCRGAVYGSSAVATQNSTRALASEMAAGEGRTCVATLCCASGTEGIATGVSMSIDILEGKCNMLLERSRSRLQKLCGYRYECLNDVQAC